MPATDVVPKTAPARTLTITDVRSEIGEDKISRASVYNAVGRGDLPSIRLGKRILIPRDGFEAWLRGNATSIQSETAA